MLAPAGTPDDIIGYVFEKLQAAASGSALRQKIEAAGNELSFMPTAEFGSFIRQDRDKWSKVIEELGLKQLKT